MSPRPSPIFCRLTAIPGKLRNGGDLMWQQLSKPDYFLSGYVKIEYFSFSE